MVLSFITDYFKRKQDITTTQIINFYTLCVLENTKGTEWGIVRNICNIENHSVQYYTVSIYGNCNINVLFI